MRGVEVVCSQEIKAKGQSKHSKITRSSAFWIARNSSFRSVKLANHSRLREVTLASSVWDGPLSVLFNFHRTWRVCSTAHAHTSPGKETTGTVIFLRLLEVVPSAFKRLSLESYLLLDSAKILCALYVFRTCTFFNFFTPSEPQCCYVA